MEYLKEREKRDTFYSSGSNISLFNGYNFNADILFELTNRDVQIEVKESLKIKCMKFDTRFTFTELGKSSSEITRESKEYKKLIFELADEIEKSEFRNFDTLALPSGVVIDPITYEPVISFMTRLYEE